jgi:methyl-accepting chemotaxis protein
MIGSSAGGPVPGGAMDKTGRTRIWRRNFFINKGLQGRFIAGFTLAVLLGLTANLLVSYFLIDRELNEELYKIHIKIRTTSEIAVPILIKLSVITIPAILAVSAAVGFFLTRRIELPLLEFREAVQSRARGDFSKDLSINMPGELPTAFNSMSRSLEAVFNSLKKSATILDKESQRLAKPEAARAELKSALEAITEARKSISLEISKFKV